MEMQSKWMQGCLDGEMECRTTNNAFECSWFEKSWEAFPRQVTSKTTRWRRPAEDIPLAVFVFVSLPPGILQQEQLSACSLMTGISNDCWSLWIRASPEWLNSRTLAVWSVDLPMNPVCLWPPLFGLLIKDGIHIKHTFHFLLLLIYGCHPGMVLSIDRRSYIVAI